jgi:competence protein ComGF
MNVQSAIKNVKWLNNRGFTLAEMLVAFSIFCLLASFLPAMIHIFMNERPMEKRLQQMEWAVFISQIKKEMRMCQKITIVNQKIVLEKDGQMIVYEPYGGNLRRRVDQKGHEILLQNIHSLELEKLVNGVLIKLKDRHGHEYREEIHVPVKDVIT